MATGKPLQVLTGHSNYVQQVAFSADSQTLATSSADKTIRLWNVASGEPLKVLTGHQNGVFAVDFIAGGKQLVSGSFDRSLRLWDVSSGVSLRLFQGHEAGIGDLSIHGKRVFSASNDGTVRSWNLALPYQQQLGLPSSPIPNALSPDLKTVAVGFKNGDLRLYDAITAQLLWEKQQAHEGMLIRLAFNPKGDLLASGSADKTAKIWSVNDSAQQGITSLEGMLSLTLQEQQTLTGHTKAIHGLSFAPDSQTLATASYDGSIGLFPLNSEQKALFIPAHKGIVGGISFDNNGTHLLSLGQDRIHKLWNLSVQPPSELEAKIPNVNDTPMWLTLSPNNQWLASVGREMVVNVYNRETQQSSRLLGHEQTVNKAIFAPDSQQLTTVAGDATARFWNIAKGNELFSLRLPFDVGKAIRDFDFRCLKENCRLSIPLTNGQLMLYRLSYEGKLKPTETEQKHSQLTLWQAYLDQTEILLNQNAFSAAKQALTEAISIGNPLQKQYPKDALIKQTAERSETLKQQIQSHINTESSKKQKSE